MGTVVDTKTTQAKYGPRKVQPQALKQEFHGLGYF